MRAQTGLLVLMTLIVLGGALAQFPVWQPQTTRLMLKRDSRTLAQQLPPRLTGGSARDEPIAATEEMRKAVGELLNYDDAVNRIYQLADARVSVYIAYWKAGRMSPRLVAGHNPDICWPGNGWTRDKQAEASLRRFSEELIAAGFYTGEARVFTMNGKAEYVVFWHIVGNEVLRYRNGWAPPWWAPLDELWRNGLELRKEQLFVRVSSDRPLQSIWARNELLPLKEVLLKLGLERKPGLVRD